MYKTKVCKNCLCSFIPVKKEEYCNICIKTKLKGGKKLKWNTKMN